jgi:copper transport protein
MTRRVVEAHAMLKSSDPAANARITTAPSQIRLLFSEAVDASVSGIELVFDGKPPRSLSVSADPHDKAALIAPVSGLAPGSYRVNWRTISVDGHRSDGSFGFIIAADTTAARIPSVQSPIAPATVSEPFPILAAVLRGIAMALIMALVGLLYFDRKPGIDGARIESICAWLSVAAVIAVTAHFITWSVNAAPSHAIDPTWIGKMTQTPTGHFEVARWLALVLAMWAVVGARRSTAGLWLAAIALVASAGIGHPAGTRPALAIPAMAIHLIAGAVWIGGLLWILLASRSEPGIFAAGVRRVSAAALWCVVAIVLTGVAQAALLLSLDELLTTSYGHMLTAKVAVALVVVAIGAYHRYRAVPRLAEQGASAFGPSLRIEITLLAIVILMAGFLSYLSP